MPGEAMKLLPVEKTTESRDSKEYNAEKVAMVDPKPLGTILEKWGIKSPDIKVSDVKKEKTTTSEVVLSKEAQEWVLSNTQVKSLIAYLVGDGLPKNGVAYLTDLGKSNGYELAKKFLSINAKQMEVVINDYNTSKKLKNPSDPTIIEPKKFLETFNKYKPIETVVIKDKQVANLSFPAIRETQEIGKLLELPDAQKTRIINSFDDIDRNKDFKLQKVVLRGEADGTGIKEPDGIVFIEKQLNNHLQLLAKNSILAKKLPVLSYADIKKVHPDWSTQQQAQYAFALTRALMQISYLPDAKLDKIANFVDISVTVNPKIGNQYTGGSIDFEGVGSHISINSITSKVDALIPVHKTVEFNIRLGDKPSADHILGKYTFRKESVKTSISLDDPATGKPVDNYVTNNSRFFTPTPDANSTYLLEAGMKNIHVRYDRGGTTAMYDIVIPDNYQSLGITDEQVDAIRNGTASYKDLVVLYGIIGGKTNKLVDSTGKDTSFKASKDLLDNFEQSLDGK